MTRRFAIPCLLVLACVALAGPGALHADDVFPHPAMDDALAPTKGRATLTLAGGCFWGVEAVYEHTKGVIEATSGYTGGTATTARFDMVKTGTTKHIESVQIAYDPSQITIGTLLKVFFATVHDPTQRGRQGPDIGPQYRSVVYYTNNHQRDIAKAYLEQLTEARVFRGSISTEVLSLQKFFKAEDELQDFVKKNPNYRYVVDWDIPLLATYRRDYPSLFR